MSVADLCASVWALSALRVAEESDLLAAMAKGEAKPRALARAARLDEAVTMRILETLEATGFAVRSADQDGFSLSAEGAELAAKGDWLRADLAATFGQSGAFVSESRRSDLGAGWRHADPETIRAQSALSRMVNASMMTAMRRALPEVERLGHPGATFLDVGTGGASIAMAFCREFPTLHAVGIDSLRAARIEARSAVAIAGLSNRIAIRGMRFEELEEEGAYDIAFVAHAFMNDAVVVEGLGRLKKALRPGGIVLFGALQTPADPKIAAATRLRWQLWGGGTRTAGDVIRLAERAGLADVKEHAALGPFTPVVARKPG